MIYEIEGTEFTFMMIGELPRINTSCHAAQELAFKVMSRHIHMATNSIIDDGYVITSQNDSWNVWRIQYKSA